MKKTPRQLHSYPEIMTPQQVAEVLQVPAKTVVMLCARGDMPACKVGRRWRIDRDALLDDFKSRAAERRRSSSVDEPRFVEPKIPNALRILPGDTASVAHRKRRAIRRLV